MQPFYEWMIPSIGFLIWVVLTVVEVRTFGHFLRKKAEQTQQMWQELLSRITGAPLISFLLGVGLKIFWDALPLIPAKWEKDLNASLILFFLVFITAISWRILKFHSPCGRYI